jgi:hypothetical protein
MRLSGPKREEMAGGWRRLHNEELYNLHDTPNIIRGIKQRWWAKQVVCMGEIRNTYKILVKKPERKRPLRKLVCR